MKKYNLFKGINFLLLVLLVMGATTLSAANPWQKNLQKPVPDFKQLLIDNQTQDDDPCAITEFPWTEDFNNEQTLPFAVPNCFGKIPVSGGAGYPLFRIQPRITGSSDNVQWVNSTGNAPSFLILPPIGEDIAMENLIVKFEINTSYTDNENIILQFGVIDPTNINSFSRIAHINVTPEQSEIWNLREFSLAGHIISNRYIAIMLPQNSNSALFDNFEITLRSDCPEPTNARVTGITHNAIYLAWNGGISDPETYMVEYKKTDESDWNDLSIPGNSRNMIIEGLDQLTNYDVRIKAECGTGESDYVVFNSLLTKCPSYTGETIGDGTGHTDGNHIPSDFGSATSFSQQIFLANEIPASVSIVSGIAFRCDGEYPVHGRRLVTVYLGETDKSSFAAPNATNWIGSNELKQVFNGHIDFSPDGWVTIPFDSVFTYTRAKNLAVVVADNSNNNISTTRNFQTHDAEADRTMYWAGSGSISANNPPTNADGIAITTYRNNIRLLHCGQFECIPPSYVNVSGISQSGATLTWARVELNAQYIVEYRKVGENDWISSGETPLDQPTYTIDNGIGATDYEFRVMTVCGFEDESDWSVTGTFTTSLHSLSLPLRESFDTYMDGTLPFGWMGKAPVAGNEPVVRRAVSDDTTAYHSRFNVLDFKAVSSSYNEVTLTNLAAQDDITAYQMGFWARFSENNPLQLLIVGLMNDPNVASSFEAVDTLYAGEANTWEYQTLSFSEYEGNGTWLTLRWMNSGTGNLLIDDIVIDRPSSCDVPLQLVVSETNGEMLLSWDSRGFPGPWIVEYDTTNFVPGTGRNSFEAGSATDIPLTDLADNTFYDIYVKSKCAENSYSWYSAPFRFRTAQIPGELPYRSDFAESNERDNWTFAGELYENEWVIGTAGNNTADDAYSLYVSNDGGHTNNHILNTEISSSVWAYRDINFNDEAYEYQLSFEWRNPASHSYINVYIDTNLTDVVSGTGMIPATAMAVATRLSANSEWRLIDYILPAHYGNKINRLYFEWYTPINNNPDIGPSGTIRNITIVPKDCPVPTGLHIADSAVYTVDLEWDGNENEQEDWLIEYGRAGFAKGSGTMVSSGTNWYQVTNLDPETYYDFYISRYCSEGDTSVWTAAVRQKTGQIPLEVPFTCDFEDDELNKHWLISNKDNNWWFIDYAANIAPERGKTLYISNDQGATNAYGGFTYGTYAIRDIQFPSVSGGEFILSFDWRCLGEADNDYMQIQIGHDTVWLKAPNNVLWPTDVRYFTTIGRFSGSSEWQQSTFTLPSSYSDTLVRLILSWRSENSGNQQPPAAIDNISIIYNSCESPKNVEVSNIRHNSAFITWTQGDGNHWEVEYKLKEEEDWTTTDVRNYSQYALNNLADSSAYQIRMRTVCGDGDTSIYSNIIDFATLRVPCMAPIVTVDSIKTTSAFASWERNGNEQGWELSYKESAETEYNEAIFLTDTFYRFSALTQGTEYTVRVRAKCDQNFSPYAERTFTTTVPSGLKENNGERNVVIYPNPAQDKLHIKAEAGYETISVINLLGKVLSTERITNTQLQINVSSYESGVYFIRLEGKNGVVTKKFIKN